MKTQHAASYYDNQRQGMLGYVTPSAKRILEVGCGHGHFGKLLKEAQSAHVTGIDISPDAIRVAANNLDRTIVINLGVDSLPFEKDEFDCIICNDVLEHLVDPWHVLAELTHSLKPEGEVVASIPNIRHHKVLRPLIWPGDWNYAEIGILDRTHLRFFTRNTIIKLFESSGLQVKLINGINPRKFPFWLKVLNFMCANALDDMRYVQFAIVGVKPISTSA